MSFNQRNNSGKDSKKKKVIIMVVVIVVLLATLVGVYAKLGIIKMPGSKKKVAVSATSDKNKDTSTSTKAAKPNNNTTTTTIPPSTNQANTQQTTKPSTTEPEEAMNPFSGPFKLSGVVLDEYGDDVAIIEGATKTYVLKVNEAIDNAWVVEEIKMNQVTLRYQGKKFILSK